MAGDWIKMRVDLYRDPKVILMADMLMDGDFVTLHSVTKVVARQTVVGALVSVWGVIRQQGKRDDDDLVATDVSLAVIDAISEVDGFGEAMRHVGWIIEDKNTLRFPQFFTENNVDPRESYKKKNAERQRRFRQKGGGNRDKWIATRKRILKRDGKICGYCGNAATTVDHILPTSQGGTGENHNLVSCCLSCNRRKNNRTPEEAGMPVTLHNASVTLRNAPREEKRREEKSIDKPPLPPELDTVEFGNAWAEWEQHRREIKKKLTPLAAKRQINSPATCGISFKPNTKHR